MPLVVEKLLPCDCLNINEFRAIQAISHSDAHEYSLEQELLPTFHNFGGEYQRVSSSSAVLCFTLFAS